MTSEAKHTPGPWRYEDCGNVESPDGHVIAEIFDGNGIPYLGDGRRYHEQAEANARLIAAAPDLLAALKLAYDALSESRGFAQSTTAIEIRAAIARAEGKE